MSLIKAEDVRKYSETHGMSFMQARAALVKKEREEIERALIEKVRYATDFQDLKQAIIYLLGGR